MKNEIHNRLKVFILRLVMGMSVASSVFADVTPVPNSVVPKKIEGVRPRNVVFILSDDHRYDAMSFMGHPFAKTPYMDAMAQEGAHLSNAFVTTSLCSPSRASILTGLYTFRHRVIDNQRPVPEGTLFFPEYLQKSGYKTVSKGRESITHPAIRIPLMITENGCHRMDTLQHC
jgi:N-acetylglucosamine-6-sulfatase